MKRYYITDRRQFDSLNALVECIRRNDAEGVDMIQIREKDLGPRDLAALADRALAACTHAKVLVNTRVDVALACGAQGAHLPDGAPAPVVWRTAAPAGFLFGVSCHNVDAVIRAEREGASFAVFAPVFDPISKAKQMEAQGIERLREACRAVRMPVYALGGITMDNAPLCADAGAAGVAGISLFQRKT